jgi:hypothetical protein
MVVRNSDGTINISQSIQDFRREKIQDEIKFAEWKIVFWAKECEKRRSNEHALGDKHLYAFIRQAKKRIKQAKDDLDYWTKELNKT